MSRRQPETRQTKTPEQTQLGSLFVVATPIGNLEDITLRALRILAEVDCIAAEDTRQTRKLLSHFDIHTPLVSYYREKEESRSQEIVAELLAGRSVALVSDAGTPGISDPGAVLVKKARSSGVPVVPVPGVSALATALCVWGLGRGSHLFLGFLPAKSAERRARLHSLRREPHDLAFYESPKRLVASLTDCITELGNRPAMVARELTKLHEECLEAPLEDLLASFTARPSIKGELVVLIEGASRVPAPSECPQDLESLLCWYRDRGEDSLKDAVKQVAGDLDLPRAEVYRAALRIWG